ncbi:hypothetical protein OROHE_005125 [Orobanche hederae]
MGGDRWLASEGEFRWKRATRGGDGGSRPQRGRAEGLTVGF